MLTITRRRPKVFGFFKKKVAPPPPPASANETIIENAAGMLHLQLMICRSQPKYLTKLDSGFVRGYLYGFFDCSLQLLGHPIHDDEAFGRLLLRGHALLLSSDLGDTDKYTIASLNIQDDPQFKEGASTGGNECHALLTNKSDNALGLMRYFHEL